jgi:hypothetical protein
MQEALKIGAGIYLILTAAPMLVLAGCEGARQRPEPAEEPVVPAGVTVIDLPAIDFARGTPRVLDQRREAQSLGRNLPMSQFAVRVSANVPADWKGAPTRGVLFCVYQENSKGRMAAGATAFLTRTSTDRHGVVTYLGVCSGQPMHRGDAIIEVSYRDKSYLVRSLQVR